MLKKEFASSKIEAGELNVIVENIMRQTGIRNPAEAVRQFNAGRWVFFNPHRYWQEHAGFIYLNVTSDGTTGPEWITRLEQNDCFVSRKVRRLLCSDDFKPTSNTYNIAIFRVNGGIDSDLNAVLGTFLGTFMDVYKLSEPSLEITCLIREKVSNDDIKNMGLSSISSRVTGVVRIGGKDYLSFNFVGAGPKPDCYGAVFVVSQVQK